MQPCSVSSVSHSATEQEGRADPAGRKGDSAKHKLLKEESRVEEAESGERLEKCLARVRGVARVGGEEDRKTNKVVIRELEGLQFD